MLHINNVSKTYPSITTCLENITFSLAPGEFVSLVGHSGAGKTTLGKIILADERPTEGEVYFQGVNIHDLSSRDLTTYRRKIGVIFQDFRLLPNKTAYENIAFAMEAVGKSDAEIESDVPHVLDLVNLSDKLFHFPHQLSGGEQQRLAIARAIINQPELIIADEPTGNLDPDNTRDIITILKKINELGTTVILITHTKDVANAIHGRVITLEKGHLIKDTKATV